MTEDQVRVWEQGIEIPTYGIGTPEKNPMFLEKRVYQGSSGKVYPYPVIDKIQDEKRPVTWRLVCLENEYLHIEILPELGGRIYRALDKTNGYDFVYYNQVIKPALVGLAGPWVSGGIEFNWPQHHRPNTYGPVEYVLSEQADGSRTVWLSEIDRMYGTKMTAGLTLYPGKAYLEIQAQLYNRTSEPQTFLWWANPAFAVHEETQSIFPPDVHAVFDHGRRDVSRFPIADGTYYKVDYSAGVDISRYTNIPVPMSYMAYRSNYDFLAGYDHRAQAGLLHIANHHVSPGKKQWTWGYGEFGWAWDRNLTDENGPYIELMAGVYTDNQPDFSWLQPYEEKSFRQYFLPYKQIGALKNATIDAALNLEVDPTTLVASLQVYATAVFAGATISLASRSRVYVDECVTISPIKTFATTIALDASEQIEHLRAEIRDANGRLLVSYQPDKRESEQLPEPAQPLPAPEMLPNNEALYLAGVHLEQYRHATFEPEAYYLEGLQRDPDDIRINVAYGTLLLRRGLFTDSEAHFRRAIATLTRHNANPYDSEAYYQLGVTLHWQERLDEAMDAFYKASWSAAWRDASFFSLAQIACAKHQYTEALDLVECSLKRNTRNYRARHLKAILLRKLDHLDESEEVILETLALDVADFGTANERLLLALARGEATLAENLAEDLTDLLRAEPRNFITLACDYARAGFYEEARNLLHRVAKDEQQASPMVHYYLSYFSVRSSLEDLARIHWQAGSVASPDYCFPNSLEDLIVLESVLEAHPEDAMAHYYLGNLLYDKKRSIEAIHHWEAARKLNDAFATVHRNLALAYYNTQSKPELALALMEQAFACNPTDARVCYERDQLYKKLGHAPEQRLASLERHQELIVARDDLYLEYVTLLNLRKQHEKALKLLTERLFHPWEGGEGKVTGQYVLACVELSKDHLQRGAYSEALDMLQRALVYPENLGEGKLAGCQENNIAYYLGCAYEGLGLTDNAREYFRAASKGLSEPTGALFYNDQPPDMIFYQGLACLKLGEEQEARRRFQKLITYGEQHLADIVSIDYFAVSLPDFLVFEDDLSRRNQVHCLYMQGLGHLGLQEQESARRLLKDAQIVDPNHQGTRIHLDLVG
jgi:tetratricopeptide (TPR) repeat protein